MRKALMKKQDLASKLQSWSKDIQWPPNGLQSCLPVAEGCFNAFNNTNFVRSALYFQTQPPVFRNIHGGFPDVKGIHLREKYSLQREIARFGPEGYLNGRKLLNSDPLPNIVLENYVPGAQNILGFKWPSSCALVLGSENQGTSEESLKEANTVLYIPQHGIISSLNIVCALAIGLHLRHSYFLRHGKVLVENKLLERSNVGDFSSIRAPRNGDKRPIRPKLYNLSNEKLLKFASEKSVNNFRVLYENIYDQKNLGGLIRNCNAFGVSKLFYHGRRKINRQGCVGSYKYLPIEYLESDKIESFLRKEVVWLLDTSQSTEGYIVDGNKKKPNPSGENSNCQLSPPAKHLYLDDLESVKEAFLKFSQTGILLAVNQESFPFSDILIRNAKVVLHVRSNINSSIESYHRGLSPCVASAIALFYLSHIMLGNL